MGEFPDPVLAGADISEEINCLAEHLKRDLDMRNHEIPKQSARKKRGGSTLRQTIAQLFKRLNDNGGNTSDMKNRNTQEESKRMKVLRIVGMIVVVGLFGWLARYGIDQVPYIGHAPGIILGTLLLVWLAPKTNTTDNGKQ